MRKPDPTEEVVQSYLEATYPSVIIQYEPYPSEPPDFILGGSCGIGIEVRRLNENLFPSAWVDSEEDVSIEPHGLEQDQHIIIGNLNQCASDAVIQRNHAYWLNVDLTGPRPLTFQGRSFRREIMRLYARSDGSRFVSEHRGFTITWEPRQSISNALAIGWFMDHEAGGWSADVYEKNLQLIINEKWGKIDKIRTKRKKDRSCLLRDDCGMGVLPMLAFEHGRATSATSSKKPEADISPKDMEEWWLVLVDHIAPHSSFLARYDDIRINRKGFSRIILIEQNGAVINDQIGD